MTLETTEPTPPAADAPIRRRSWDRPVVVLLVLLAGAVRLWDFPARHDVRDVDEIGYISGSMHLLEGLMPELRYTPAGPQTWAGWLYGLGLSGYYLVAPPPDVQAAGMQAKPFLAVNAAIFDTFHDLSTLRYVWAWTAFPFILWSVVAGFNVGRWRGGLAGGVLIGSLAAFTPLFIDLSGQGRPYAMAWALAIVSLDLGLVPREKARLTFAAVVFGLALASRIDMLMLAPLFWSAIWADRRERGFVRPLICFHLVAVMTSLLAAPWLLTSMIGNLRAIATVFLAPHATVRPTFVQTLLDVVWNNGLALVVPLAIASVLVPHEGRRIPRIFAGLFVLLLIASIFKSTGFGLRHQGAPVIAMLISCAAILPMIARRSALAAWIVVAVALAFPVGRSVADVVHRRRNYVPDEATAWIEKHVPPGTRIYLEPTFHDPLPTTGAADAMWKEVNDHPAWRTKFESGLARFGITTADLPRALSDENMTAERGNLRGQFILGSRPTIGPRFDIRWMWCSVVFGVRDVATEFRKTGGIVLYHDLTAPRDNKDHIRQIEEVKQIAGEPIVEWIAPSGRAVRIYASPDMRSRLMGATTRPTTSPTTSDSQ